MSALADSGRKLVAGLPPWLLPAIIVVALLALPFTSPARMVQLTVLFGINALLAQSINLLTGYAGQISLGQAAVYGAGAYGSGVLTVQYDWPVWAAAPAGVTLAVMVGVLVSIPAGRVREFYLAMVTLGLGLLAFEVMRQWSDVTGGFSGLNNIPSPPLGSLTVGGIPVGLVTYYYLVLVIVVAVTWLLMNVVKSHLGRSFVAVQENELAAATLGVDTARRKRLAYVLSAVLAGIAGVLYAHLVGFISPEAFGVNASIAILVFAVLGGMRTMAGPFLGAGLLTFLPDQLQSFSEYQQLLYGLVLLLSFIVLPRGLAGLLPYRTPLIHHGIDRNRDTTGVHADDAPQTPQRLEDRNLPVELLKVDALVKTFTGVRALDGVSMSVRRGSIHGLIGPNGSGKTTMLNVISGVYTASDGRVEMDGRSPGRNAHEVARQGISRTFQHPLVFDELTVRENVLVGAERRFRSRLLPTMFRLPGARTEERTMVLAAEDAVRRTGLHELQHSLAGTLPFGRKRMLELARSMASEPVLLMLDEPAAGLAEDDLDELAELLSGLRDAGMTILIIEHHMDFLLDLVDEVTVLDHGQVIFSGKPAGARADERVLEAYLGKPAETAEV